MAMIISGLVLMIIGGVAYIFRLQFVSLGLSPSERAFVGMAILSDEDYRLAYDILTYAGVGVAVVGLVLLVIGIVRRMPKKTPTA